MGTAAAGICNASSSQLSDAQRATQTEARDPQHVRGRESVCGALQDRQADSRDAQSGALEGKRQTSGGEQLVAGRRDGWTDGSGLRGGRGGGGEARADWQEGAVVR